MKKTKTKKNYPAPKFITKKTASGNKKGKTNNIMFTYGDIKINVWKYFFKTNNKEQIHLFVPSYLSTVLSRLQKDVNLQHFAAKNHDKPTAQHSMLILKSRFSKIANFWLASSMALYVCTLLAMW